MSLSACCPPSLTRFTHPMQILSLGSSNYPTQPRTLTTLLSPFAQPARHVIPPSSSAHGSPRMCLHVRTPLPSRQPRILPRCRPSPTYRARPPPYTPTLHHRPYPTYVPRPPNARDPVSSPSPRPIPREPPRPPVPCASAYAGYRGQPLTPPCRVGMTFATTALTSYHSGRAMHALVQ